MSGSSRRRHSKWDHKDSEALPENFYDRAQPRRPREPLSPGRGSRRHDSRSKESMMTWDREGNCTRMSPALDEWRPRHSSRSPRNGWRRVHRISKSKSRSRSRSRSQSPAHNYRREPTINDRSRSRSGVSAQICRDFAAGRCRRGNSCHFLHQDAQLYDNRQPPECGPPDDWESRRRRTGGSNYSPDDSKDNVIRTDKSAPICNEYLKGRCRRGDSCRYVHHDVAADVFEKGPLEDVYRNRGHEHRSRDTYPDHDHRSRDTYPDPDLRRRDTYPDRNRECEPPKRGETPCKFFAAGNCRNGIRCRFSHQVQESFSPERRSQDDRRDPGHKYEGGQVWDGPRWSDVTTVSTVPEVQGWGEDKSENKEESKVRAQGDGRGPDKKYEGDRVWDGPSWSNVTTMPNVPVVQGLGYDKNEITEVTQDSSRARPEEDSWSHDMLNIKQTWDAPATIEKPQIQDKMQPPQWKTESNISGVGLSASGGKDFFSGDMEISPRDTKQLGMISSTSQTPPISNLPFAAFQQNMAGEALYEKHYQAGSQEQKLFNGPFAEENPNYKDKKPILYSEERGDVVGEHDGLHLIQNQRINILQGQGIFQPDQNVSAHPISNLSPPGQSRLSLPIHPSRGGTMQSLHKPPSLLDNIVADGSHIVSFASSALAPSGQSQLSLPTHPSRGGTMQVSHDPSSFSSNKVVDGSPVVSLASSAVTAPGQSQLSLPVHPSLGETMHVSHDTSSFLDNKVADGSHVVNLASSALNPPGQSQLSSPTLNPPGQSQLSFPTHPLRGETMQVSHISSSVLDNKIADGSHVVSLASSAVAPGSATAHGTVSNEQLAQLSHLTASLTQLLESRQQLSQFSSAATSHCMSNLSDLAAPIIPVSGAMIQQNQAPEVLQQYDPLCSSIQPKKPILDNHLLPSVEHRSSNTEHHSTNDEIHHEGGDVNQQEPLAISKDEENGITDAEGRIKALENGPSQDVGADDGPHDDKKLKDTKGIRPFKFALAEFVKELLKPAWKDGQVSKDAYKTIVKKVVDKVTETLGPQIPQTKEKIDLYLSCSKPKIEKLLQAYVGKHQKS